MTTMTTATQRPVVWSVAGSDSGAGAGVQADLRAFDAMDVHGCTAIAAITAQNSVAVERIEPVATTLLDAQLAALASDMPPQAIKTGMLGSVANLRCVVAWVDRLRSRQPVALVVDPVWRATTGAALADADMRDAMLQDLLPRATVLTPNRREAAWLLGIDAAVLDSAAAVEQAAAALRAFGPQSVVITGGDAGSGHASDCLDAPEARGWLVLPRVDTPHHHGSGCVFAASIAAALARGFCAADAAVIAKMSTTRGLREAQRAGSAGQGAGAVRPVGGFGLDADVLPALHAGAGGRGSVEPFSVEPFLPLTEHRMGLYAVVDSAEAVARVLVAGVRTVQLRIKTAAPHELADEIRRSIQLARSCDAQLFINDHWQLAIAHGAYGVHLGQEDLQEADLGALRAAGVRLGVSTHSYWEVCRARACAPSYIACGPIHATVTKAMAWRPQGPGNLAYWCRVLREPVVAIAGMDEPRSLEATRCGAAGVAVLRGLAASTDLRATVDGLMAAIEQGGREAPLAAPSLPRPTLVPGCGDASAS
jgi:hydroxymethylpyrimidine kinase / phosphomethylpyrimidine kinase / thiamine-phosphate diphosphorylase